MADNKYISLAIVIVALIVVGGYLLVNYQPSGKIISATGNAEIKAQPDIVTVYVVVEALNESAQESKDENAEITDKVITELIKLGFDRDEIQTENFNIYEDFDWTESGRKSKGWKAVNNIAVKTSDFKNVGKVVDAVVDN